MPDSLHEIKIAAPPSRVFEAWTMAGGLSSWWTADSRVSEEAGGGYVFSFGGGAVKFHFRGDRQEQNRSIRWTGIEGEGMPPEWVGTRIEADLAPHEDKTRLRFAHRNWKSAEGMFPTCNTTWGALMYRLRDYCEGKGRGPLFAG